MKSEGTIINLFNTEEELRNVYPKKFYFELKEIINDYWDDFLVYAENHNLKIRTIVKEEVEKMRVCKSKALGYSVFECPNCHKESIVYNTCKSRFCNSCGIKYSKQRTTEIMSHVLDCTHRHLVFTMPDFLWPIFQKDRSLLDLTFKAVSITLNSWCKEKYKKYKLGFILTLHTFGRDDKWNVHIHCLIAERLISKFGDKKIDFFPYVMLRHRWQTVLLNILEKKLGSSFIPVKNKSYKLYNDGFYIRAKKNEFPDTKKGIEYILRYCGRPCFAQYRIIDIRDDYITFWYQRHEDDKFVVERIHVFEFIGRLIKHIPERNFKTIRYCGFYSSKFKSILKDCRKLWDDLKASFHKSMTKWRNMSLSSFNKDPLLCSCGYVMMFSYRVPRLE